MPVGDWTVADVGYRGSNALSGGRAFRIQVNGRAKPSPVAELTELSLSIGGHALALSQAFAPGTEEYTALALAALQGRKLTLSHLPDDGGAVEIFDSDGMAVEDVDPRRRGVQVLLANGPNTFRFRVRSSDGTTARTYTVVVTQAAKLVANRLQVTKHSDPVANNTAQAFSTGAHPGGYALTYIGFLGFFQPSDGSNNTVTLHEGSRTGTKVADFDASGSTVLSLTPTSDVTLKPSTTYYVVTGNDFGTSTWWTTDTNDEDEDSMEGWTIADELLSLDQGSWETVSPRQAQIVVEGHRVPSGDATLRALDLKQLNGTAIALFPAFDPATDTYSAIVNRQQINIFSQANDELGTVEFFDEDDAPIENLRPSDGGHSVFLSAGLNIVKVRVTSGDGTVGRYTLRIVQAYGASTGEFRTLVSNEGQARRNAADDATNLAQAFTTGPNGNGYLLESVLLQGSFSPGDANTVTLHQGTRSGTKVANFNSTIVNSGGGLSLTPTSTVILGASTTYFVVTSGDFDSSDTWHETQSNNEDASSATGWTIENTSEILSGANWVTYGRSLKFTVNGAFINSNPQVLRDAQRRPGQQQVAADPPTVDGAPGVSDAGPDGQWTEGETVEVTLTFSEAVDVDTAGGTPSIGLALSGIEARSAEYLRGSGTAELVFGYTLVAGDGSHSTMSVTPDSLATGGGTIRASDGSADAALGHEGAAVIGIPPLGGGDIGKNRGETPPGTEDGGTGEPEESASPVFSGATSVAVAENETAVATLAATDADTPAADLSWTLNGGADRAAFALTETGALSFVQPKDFESPDDADADGSYQVTVQVSDGGNAATANLTVTLTDVNEAPAANAGADQAGIPGATPVTLSGAGTDPDAGDTLAYAWARTSGPAVTLRGADTATATFTAPAGLTQDTAFTFELAVTDAAGLAGTDSVTVTVARGAALTAAFENVPDSHDGATAFDVRLRFSEEVNLSYRAFAAGLLDVTGATVGTARRLAPPSNVGWAFPVTPAGDADVVLTLPAGRACDRMTGPCTDDGRRLARTASVTVAGPVRTAAPEITGATGFTVAEGDTAVATLTATDEDTPAADLSWSIPGGAAGGADRGGFTITPSGVLAFAAAKDYEDPDDANADGAYQLTVEVSDGANTDTADLTVTLANVNEAPTADAGPDQDGVAEGATVTLSGSGTDPDAGDALSYAWTRTAGPAVTLAGAQTATATFTAPTGLTADASYTFRLEVTDAGGLSHEDTVAVTVTPPSDDATLSSLTLSGVDIGAFSGATLSYRASVDSGVSSTTVTVTPTDGGASVSIAAGGATTAGTSRSVALSAGENVIAVTVTAADGRTAKTYTVTVTRAESALEWGQRLEERDIALPDGSSPTGLWSDGETLWVITDWSTGTVARYSLADGTAIGSGSSHSFTLGGGAGFPAGLWSDGSTLWVADFNGGVRAYRLSDGTRLSSRDIGADGLAAAGNNAPTGLWSDGDTLWVADYWGRKVFAYRLSDGARLADEEFDLRAANGSTPVAVWGLWSNGATALVTNYDRGGVEGYALADGARKADRALAPSATGSYPMGLWSDGETLWIVNELEDSIRAYAATGLSAAATNRDAGPFDVRVETRADAVPDGADPGPAVFMPDAALRGAVAAALRLGPGEELGVNALASLRALNVRGAGVADLTGLDYAVNLKALDLGNNPVAELWTLGLLPRLRTLNLDGAASDLRPLAGLVGLERLSLRGNGLTDLSALAGQTELRVLSLGNNRVSDLRPLAGLANLEALDLRGNAVRDRAPLAGLANLRDLDLGGNPAGAPEAGAGLPAPR